MLKTGDDAVRIIKIGGGPSPETTAVERLPKKALDKLHRLERQRDDLFAATRSSFERYRDAHRNFQAADTQLQLLVSAGSSAERTEHEVERLTREFERRESENKNDSRVGQEHPCPAILEWLKRLPVGCSLEEFIDSEPPTRPRSSPKGWLSVVESHRSEIGRLRAELHRVACAPIPSSVAKRLAREHVAALAERGAPDVFGLIESAAEITYPEWQHAPLGVHVTDAVAVMAWLDPDKFIAHLESEIDRRSDDAAALSSEQRDEQRGRLLVALLKAERAEEAAIEAAELEGANILRRRDADPRAVLGLASTLPAPKFA